MKTLLCSWKRTFLAASLLVAAPLVSLQAATNSWTGAGADNNWSTVGNWSAAAVPVLTDDLVFTNADTSGTFSPTGLVNNVVDVSYTVQSLKYNNLSPAAPPPGYAVTTGYHHTLIPAGVTLTLAPPTGAGDALFVGNGVDSGANAALYSTVEGAGSLTISPSAMNVNVRQGSATSGSHRATLDLSGLRSFTATVNQFLVGGDGTSTAALDRPAGTLLLADTNRITVTNTAASGSWVLGRGANNGGDGVVQLGIDNVINADVIKIGTIKSTGTLRFRPGLTSSKVTFRAKDGTGRVPTFAVGDMSEQTGDTSYTSTGTVDLDGEVDALLDTLWIGRSLNATTVTNRGPGVGTVSFSGGKIDANVVNLGVQTMNGTNTANATGTLTVRGTGWLLASNVVVGADAGNVNGIGTGTLNIEGGKVEVTGFLGETNGSGGNATSTLNLSSNAVLNLQPAGDAAPGTITVDTLTLTDSSIYNAGQITFGSFSGSGVLTNVPVLAGTSATAPLVLGGRGLPGALTNVGNLTLTNLAVFASLTNSTTAAGALNDYLSVEGNLTLNTNALVVDLMSPVSAGTYPLVAYTGTRSGAFAFTNFTRYTAAIDYNDAAKRINYVVSGGSPASLTWGPSFGYNWDVNNVPNWNAGAEKFYQADSVAFGPSPIPSSVVVAAEVWPASVTVNSASDYTFTSASSGRIRGATGLTKSGGGVLALNLANDFGGDLRVNEGTLRPGNGGALGTTDGKTIIASGATYDVNAQNVGNEELVVQGAGVGGTGGAINNTGGSQQSALRYVTLAGDTVFRADANRWDIHNAPATGGRLAGNGYKLTKQGIQEIWIKDVGDIGVGDIDIQQGTLGIQGNPIGLGDPTKTVTVASNAALRFWATGTNQLNKKVVLQDGGRLGSGNGDNHFYGPVTLNGTNTLDIGGTAFSFWGPIGGSGSLVKISGAPMILGGTNTYTGTTLISAGTLRLAPQGSIATTPAITLASGTSLDAVMAGGLTLAGGQTLGGSGSVTGNVVAGATTKLIPGGLGAGTLTFQNHLTLTDAAVDFELGASAASGNDRISVSNNLTLGGTTTVKVIPTAALETANPYTLFTNFTALTGGTANLNVVSDSRYTFNLASSANAITLAVQSGTTAAGLLWKGGDSGNPTRWDVKTTSNWLNSAATDAFYTGDSVGFNDTATTPTVSLSGTLQASTIGITNATLNYAFGGSGDLGAASLTKQGSGTATLGHGGALAVPNITVGAGSLVIGNGTANAFSAVANSGVLTLANSGPNTWSSLTLSGGGTLVFDQALDVTAGNVISGTGSVEKRGPNTLLLSGANTFAGPLYARTGVLKLGNALALGATNANDVTVLTNDATLDLNGQAITNETFVIQGAGHNGQGVIINTGGSGNAIGFRPGSVLQFAGDVVTGGPNRWDIRDSANGIRGNGYKLTVNQPVVSINSKSILMNVAETDLGDIEVLKGQLQIEGSTTMGRPGNQVTVQTNGVFYFWSSAPLHVKPITLNSGAIFNDNGTLNLSNRITITGPATFEVDTASGNPINVYGTVEGPGTFVKTNSGWVHLYGSNLWTGGTLIAGGTLRLAGGGTQVPGPITNNATLELNSSNSFTLATTVSGGGALTQSGTGTTTLDRPHSYFGATTISAGALRITDALALGSNVVGTTIGGGNPFSPTRGQLELTGGLTLAEPLTLGGRNGLTVPLGYTVNTPPHVVNVGGTNAITENIGFTTGGGNYVLQSDAGLLTIQSIISSLGGDRAIALQGAGHGAVTGRIGSSGGGQLFVFKAGAGTWTLSGTNDWTGTTAISNGVLQVTGLLSTNASTNWVYVAGSGTLSGTGVIDRTVNLVNGGTLAPGIGIGRMTVGAAVLGSNGVFAVEIANVAGTPGTGWDLLTVNGDVGLQGSPSAPTLIKPVSLAGAVPGAVTNFSKDQNYTWAIATGTATNLNPALVGVDYGSFSNDLGGGVFSLGAADTNLYLVFTRNLAPTAGTATYTRAKGTTVKILISELLTNATADPDGDARQLVSVGTPTAGTVVTNADYILYDPSGDGADSFTFTVKDNRNYRSIDTVRTAQGTINIQVAPAAGVAQGVTVTGTTVSLNLAGIPGYTYQVERSPSLTPPVTWTAVGSPVTAPSTGVFRVTDNVGPTPPPQMYYRLRQP